MIIGFAKHGSGLSGPALDYLTGYLVNGETRSVKPEVVRGNIDAVAEVIDSLPFARRYSSGVLSFAPEDRVTPQIKEDIVNRFEDAVFVDIPPDRRSIVWIKHEDKGRTELHFVAARVDLGTRKSLNIAPPTPASRHLLDTLRESINRRYNLADPTDPERAQSVSIPSHVAKLAAQAKRLGRSAKPDIRQEIANQVEAQVAAGTIASRTDVLAFLKSEGFAVARAGINYITIVLPISGERVRLKGNIFREYFCPRDLEPVPGRSDPARLLGLDRRLERLVEKRAQYHRARYGINEPTAKDLSNLEDITNDRTRNAIAQPHSTIGEVSPGTRAAIRHDTFSLNQAAQRFSVASLSLESARQRLVQADRSFAINFDQAVTECGRVNRIDSLIQKHGTVSPSPHSRQRGPERELTL